MKKRILNYISALAFIAAILCNTLKAGAARNGGYFPIFEWDLTNVPLETYSLLSVLLFAVSFAVSGKSDKNDDESQE